MRGIDFHQIFEITKNEFNWNNSIQFIFVCFWTIVFSTQEKMVMNPLI